MHLRPDQIAEFDNPRSPHFETFMVGHLREFTPLHSLTLGDDGVRELIRSGIERAGTHDFTERGPIILYVETIVLLGIAFDTDPQYPWIHRILTDRSQPQVDRADRLYGALLDYLHCVGGPDRVYARAALRRARAMPLAGIPRSDPDFGPRALEQLASVHHEKTVFLGSTALLSLVSRAEEEARRWHVATDEGVALFIALMFALGHGFVDDPKYPWIKHSLQKTDRGSTESHRVQRLYSKTMTYLDHVLQHIGG